LFGNDQPTRFDLNFRVAGFPVRVSPWFWIVMAMLGSNIFQDEGPLYLLLWIACGFVSIMVHELGHAVAIRRFGSPAEISLIAFGGLARPLYPQRSTVKRILISLAGPGAGFGLLGIVVVTALSLDWESQNGNVRAGLEYLFFMNLIWNLFNLLPIWPLDGGQVGRDLFALAKRSNPDAAIHMLSLVVAGSLAGLGVLALLKIGNPALEVPYLRTVVAYMSQSPMLTLWMALFAFTNYQMLQMAQRRGYYYEDDDTPPWRRN